MLLLKPLTNSLNPSSPNKEAISAVRCAVDLEAIRENESIRFFSRGPVEEPPKVFVLG